MENIDYEVPLSRKSRREQQRGNKKDKPKKKFKIIWSILLGVLVIVLAIAALQIPKIISILNTFEGTDLPTFSKSSDKLGILILGMDKDGGENSDAGHTDSITYIGANLMTKKAYALPIYRDANIPVTCTATNENINRIYAQSGVECMAESVSLFLDLPIDNYVLLTMDGFIEIINELGTLSLTPKESFCSKYGIDKSIEYCFTAGVTEEMTADQAMAYLRYRASGNGEGRANRQVEIIKAVKDRCMEDMMGCYNKVGSHFASALKTNFSISNVSVLMDVFGSRFDFETLDVIQGENVEVSPKNWSQFIDEQDKIAKTDIIRQEIFA